MKIFVSAIYGVGAFVVIILASAVFMQEDFVPFPEAMLPMKFYELAEIWLAIGFLPMTLATIFFRKYHKIFSRIIFLPSIICAGFVILILCEVLNAFNS